VNLPELTPPAIHLKNGISRFALSLFITLLSIQREVEFRSFRSSQKATGSKPIAIKNGIDAIFMHVVLTGAKMLNHRGMTRNSIPTQPASCIK